MRLLVISDIHGNYYALERVVKKHPEANALLFLGDGERDIENISDKCKMPIYSVSGNCDWGSLLPSEKILEFGGKKILITHGDKYKVKFGVDYLLNSAKQRNIDIVCFGHTHVRFEQYVDICAMNPGSLSQGSGSYGMIDITDRGEVIFLFDSV